MQAFSYSIFSSPPRTPCLLHFFLSLIDGIPSLPPLTLLRKIYRTLAECITFRESLAMDAAVCTLFQQSSKRFEIKRFSPLHRCCYPVLCLFRKKKSSFGKGKEKRERNGRNACTLHLSPLLLLPPYLCSLHPLHQIVVPCQVLSLSPRDSGGQGCGSHAKRAKK